MTKAIRDVTLFLKQLLRSILVIALLAGQGVGAQAMTHGQGQSRMLQGEFVVTPAKAVSAPHCVAQADCQPASRVGTAGCCDFICGTSCMMFLDAVLPAFDFELGTQPATLGYSSDLAGISADVDPRPPRSAS